MDTNAKSMAGQSFWAQAYQNLRSARTRVVQRFNKGRSPHQFRVGDTVMYRKHLVSSKSKNVTGKIMLRWSEPLVIAQVANSNNVSLANPNTGLIVRKAHVSQLKPYVK